jgi:hypothetical protein
MKLATVVYNLTKEGHHIQRENVTPAEHLLIVAEHHANSGGKPVVSVKETGDTTKVEVEEGGKKVVKTVPARTAADEVARLSGRYAANKINFLFPGADPKMPTTFEEAEKRGVQLRLPSSKLTEFNVV